jgi:hypothetical protein
MFAELADYLVLYQGLLGLKAVPLGLVMVAQRISHD